MAKAPQPGSAGTTKGNARSEAAERTLRLTISGETRVLRSGAMPLSERLVCRKATGLPVETFLAGDTFGEDSLMVIWWLAGRQTGDPFLTLKQVEADWPADLSYDDIDLGWDTGDDEDEGGDDPS